MTYIDPNGIMDSTLTPETFEYPAAIKFPAALKKQITEYETLWAAWDAASLHLTETHNRYQTAEKEDHALLLEAIKAGDGDPGTPAVDAVAKGVRFDMEKTRQTALTVTLATRSIVAALTKDLPDIVRQVVDIERGSIEAHQEAHRIARETLEQADAAARTIGQTYNWITGVTCDHARPYLEANYPNSTLPRAYELEQPYVLNQLVLLEEAHGIESTDTPNTQQ